MGELKMNNLKLIIGNLPTQAAAFPPENAKRGLGDPFSSVWIAVKAFFVAWVKITLSRYSFRACRWRVAL